MKCDFKSKKLFSTPLCSAGGAAEGSFVSGAMVSISICVALAVAVFRLGFSVLELLAFGSVALPAMLVALSILWLWRH